MALLGRILSKPLFTGDLSRKMAAAASWSMMQLFAQYAFRLGSNLIMTRLLLPDAFGLLALATTVVTALVLFTDLGISRAIIRENDGDQPIFLRVAWSLNLLISSFVAAVVVLVGGLLWWLGPNVMPPDTVYADPRLPLLIMLCGLAPIITGLGSSNQHLVSRNLDYRRITLVTLGAQFVSIIAMILFALASPTVWALFAGMIVNQVIISASTHLFLPGHKMGWHWDRVIFGRLWSFGKWIILSSGLTFFQMNADKFILAVIMAPISFGLYIIAQIWSEAAKQLVRILGSRVGFPALSHVIRTRPHDLPRVYRKFQTVIDVFCLVGFAFMLFGGQLLVDILYSHEYADAGHFVVLLALSFLTARFDTMNNIILNFGESKSLGIMSAIRTIGLCILMPLGYYGWGIDGFILGTALAGAVSAPYAIYRVAVHTGYTALRLDILWVVFMPVATILVYAMA